MRVHLWYGKDGLDVELPDANVRGVLTHRPAPRLEDPVSAIEQALRKPIGTPPLEQLAHGRKDACIVICDLTRPVPNRLTLPPMLDALNRAGISDESVTVLIATGTHRPNVGHEVRELVGEEVESRVRIENHYCEQSRCRDYGVTPRGTPVLLNRIYTDADVKITAGMIEPHFMAGYAGGRKMVMPGVAGLASVLHGHGPAFLDHPLATNGELVGNPVHEEALFIARMARPDFILDVTLDGSKQINGVFAGDMEAAWEAGVAFSAQQTTATIAEPVDIVLTTSGGYPLDLTYYQVVKGMVGALPIVKPGGTIVLAAACAEGVGNAVFRENLLRWKRLEDFMDSITRPGAVFAADQWQIEELARCVRHNEVVHVCEGIDRGTHERLFVRPADSVEEAMDYALRKHGANATIAAIPAGPYVTAKLAG